MRDGDGRREMEGLRVVVCSLFPLRSYLFFGGEREGDGWSEGEGDGWREGEGDIPLNCGREMQGGKWRGEM